MEDDSDGSDGGDPKHRDFDRYDGYWHGFTFIIFDSENPDGGWIRSTYWVAVAPPDGERDGQG